MESENADAAAIAAALAEIGEEFDPSSGFAVYPRTSCPHLDDTALCVPAKISMDMRCSVCKEDEVWICGTCGKALCCYYY